MRVSAVVTFSRELNALMRTWPSPAISAQAGKASEIFQSEFRFDAGYAFNPAVGVYAVDAVR